MHIKASIKINQKTTKYRKIIKIVLFFSNSLYLVFSLFFSKKFVNKWKKYFGKINEIKGKIFIYIKIRGKVRLPSILSGSGCGGCESFSF